MKAELLIRLLGTPDMSPRQAGKFFPAKAFQVLALLARAPNGRLTRKAIAAMLWDSQSEEASLTNLRQLVVRLKKATVAHSELLDISSDSLALGGNKDIIDLPHFEALISQGGPSGFIEAVGLYRGELLEGIDETTDTFAHWLLTERNSLREAFFLAASSALIELTRYGRASIDDLELIARKMLALEPEREQSYRALIEAYGRNGMFEQASRLFDALCAMLKLEHDVGPSPETAAVARRIFSSTGQYRSMSMASERPSSYQPRVAFLAPALPVSVEQSTLLRYFFEDVANELGRYRSFTILAPHSSLPVHHESGMPRDNTLLRADYSISGFIKPDSEGATLALRMVNIAAGEIAWSGEFSVSIAQLVKSFSTLSLRVATSLGVAIENERLAVLRRNIDGHAYLSYLDGQHWLANCDLPRLRRARRCFKQSVDSDPRFVPARARIAQTLYLEWIQLGGRDPDLLNQAREQSDIALALDPDDAIGHWMKGTVALYQRDFEVCEAKLAEAEALCPNSADLQVQFGDALSHMGNADAGWRKFERAIDLNPLAPDHYWWAGASIAFHQRSFQKAIDLCGKLADDEPVLPMLAASHALLGDLEQARIYGGRLKDLFPHGLAIEKSARVTPDRFEEDRRLSLDGLRLAGVI